MTATDPRETLTTRDPSGSRDRKLSLTIPAVSSVSGTARITMSVCGKMS